MGRVPCCQKDEGLKKGPWTPEEDQKLISFIDKHGHENWRALPKRCGLLRCGKSCRLRWTNYLRPDIKRGRFSQSEEQKIIQLHALVGNKWSFIASQLPKRTDNEIKNYWNTVLKKRMQKISSMFASAQRLLNRKPAAASSDTTTTTTVTNLVTNPSTNHLINTTNDPSLSSSSSSSLSSSSSSSLSSSSSSMSSIPPQDTSSALLNWSFSINPNSKSTACSNHTSSKTTSSLISDILAANHGNAASSPTSKMPPLAAVIKANDKSPTTNPNPNPNSSTTTTLSTNASSSSSSASVASSSSSSSSSSCSSSSSSSSFSHLAQWESARLQAEARLNANASIRPASGGSNSSLLNMNHINSSFIGTTAATTTTATNCSKNVVTSSWLSSSPITPSLVPAESPGCNNSYNHKYKLNHRSKQQQQNRSSSSSSSSFSLQMDGFNANNVTVDGETMSVNPTLKRSPPTINNSTSPLPKYSKADANAQAINICSLLMANYKSNSRLNGTNNNNNNHSFSARSMSMNLSSDRKGVGKIDNNSNESIGKINANNDESPPKPAYSEPSCITTSALKLGPNGKLTWKTKDLSQLLVSKAKSTTTATNNISSTGPTLLAQCSRNKRMWQSEPSMMTMMMDRSSPKVAKAGNSLSNNGKNNMKSAKLDHDALIHDQFMNNVHADRPSSNANPNSIASISARNVNDHTDVIIGSSGGRNIIMPMIGPDHVDDESNMVDMDNLSEILLQMESSATCTEDHDHEDMVSTPAWANRGNDDGLDMVGKPGAINPIMDVLNIGEEGEGEEEEEEDGEEEELEVEVGEDEENEVENDEDRTDETNYDDDDDHYKYILSKNGGKCLDGYSKSSTSISSGDDYASINEDHHHHHHHHHHLSQMIIMGDDHNNDDFNTGYHHHHQHQQHNHDIMMMMMNQYGNNINKDYNMVLPKLVTSDHHDCSTITRHINNMNSTTNIHHQHNAMYDHDHDNHDDHQYYNNDSMSGLLMMDPYNDEDNNDHESCSLLIDHEAMGGGGSCHDMLMLGGADDHEIITNGRSSFHMDEILMDHSLMSAKDADADLIVDTIDTSNASQYALQFETLVRELLES